MKSAEHATIGALVGVVPIFTLFPAAPISLQASIWLAGVFLSVFIDLDHFVIARRMTGDWSNLWRAVFDPKVGLIEQEAVFVGVDEPMLRQYRLLSHLLLGGVLVVGSAAVDSRLALLVAVLLYAHVVADLVRDTELA